MGLSRSLLPRLAEYEFHEMFQEAQYIMLELLFNNSFMVDPNGAPGTGDLEERFLCAVVEDEDLPWDIDGIDW
jgi:hypothetical protein